MWQPTSKPNHFPQQPPQATANLLGNTHFGLEATGGCIMFSNLHGISCEKLQKDFQ